MSLPLTYGIANKGVSCMQSLVFRLHHSLGGYERSPQSLTSHTAETLGKEILVFIPPISDIKTLTTNDRKRLMHSLQIRNPYISE